jgi:hypothetical protein
MLTVEVLRLLPVTPDALFDLMSDFSRWPAFYPDFVCFAGGPPSSWQEPGATMTVVTRLLGREVAVEMVLEVFQPGRLVCYQSRQRGLPDAVHRRAFIAHPEGCVFQASVSYPPRPGVVGVIDHVLIRPAVIRKLRRAGANLARLVGSGVAASGDEALDWRV